MPHLSLAQAKAVVTFLENDKVAEANKIIEKIDFSVNAYAHLFSKIGELTRDLHDALMSFNHDPRLLELTGQHLPDAKNRLTHVIKITDNAANTTMDAIDCCVPLADKFINDIDKVMPGWKNLMQRNLDVGEFKILCHSVDVFLKDAKGCANELHSKLTEILMAQEFQDLTGQIINRVIELIQEIENKLVIILKVCSQQSTSSKPMEKTQEEEDRNENKILAEGPIIDAESRSGVISDQDDVDDLLQSLGF